MTKHMHAHSDPMEQNDEQSSQRRDLKRCLEQKVCDRRSERPEQE
jgi:hypothetical protein